MALLLGPHCQENTGASLSPEAQASFCDTVAPRVPGLRAL